MARGDHLFLQAEARQRVYLVNSGCLKVYKLLPDGRCQVVEFLYGGDFFCGNGDGLSAPGAQAVSEVKICGFERSEWEDISGRYPQLARRQLEATERSVRAMHSHLLAIGRLTAVERVAAFLLESLDRQHASRPNDGSVHVPMTREDIADYLGLRLETVSRAFTRLRREGLVSDGSRSRLLHLDRRADLERLACGLSVDEPSGSMLPSVGESGPHLT